jgi:hypothetical protein
MLNILLTPYGGVQVMSFGNLARERSREEMSANVSTGRLCKPSVLSRLVLRTPLLGSPRGAATCYELPTIGSQVPEMGRRFELALDSGMARGGIE